jgi:hypothetical protein
MACISRAASQRASICASSSRHCRTTRSGGTCDQCTDSGRSSSECANSTCCCRSCACNELADSVYVVDTEQLARSDPGVGR